MKFILIILATLTFETQAFAQVKDPLTPDPRVNAHDTLANDPSPVKLELSSPIPQKNLVAAGVGKLLIGGMLLEWIQESFNRYSHLLKKHPDWFDVLKIHQDRYQPKPKTDQP